MRKIVISSTILIVLVLFFVYLFKTPKWEGTTKDGNIKAILFETNEGSKKVYDGEIFWTEKNINEKEAAIIQTEYYVNGKREAFSYQKSPKIQGRTFVVATKKPGINDKIEVLIRYTLKKKLYTERIDLHKKRI